METGVGANQGRLIFSKEKPEDGMQFIHQNGAGGPIIESYIAPITSSGFARFQK